MKWEALAFTCSDQVDPMILDISLDRAAAEPVAKSEEPIRCQSWHSLETWKG